MTPLEVSQQAYALRNLRAGPDEKLEAAIAKANAKRTQELQANHEAEVELVASMQEPKIADAVTAITSKQLQRQLKHQAETAQELMERQRNAALVQVSWLGQVVVSAWLTSVQVIQARFNGDDVCQIEKPDGNPCGKPLARNQTMCAGHRAYQMRRPTSLTPKEWEAEKERREKEREQERLDRYKRNKDAADFKAKTKKLRTINVEQAAPLQAPPRSAPPPPPPPPMLQGKLVSLQHRISAQSATNCVQCGKSVDNHRAACHKCQAVCHDVAECIGNHKKTCSAMDTAE